MKKFKSIAAIAAFAVAIFGAAATDIFASNEPTGLNPLATFYKSDCSQVTANCNPTGSEVCKTSYPNGDQLFDKDLMDRCVVEIYKP